jgi:O-acetylhomoserine/O-acetylserine sulfhydrylase-like pyridoxal-dependent enzyme
VRALVSAGGEVVAQVVHRVISALRLVEVLPRFGARARAAPQSASGALSDAVDPNMKPVMRERRANPLMVLVGFAAVARIARAHGTTTVCAKPLALPPSLARHAREGRYGAVRCRYAPG